jgi:hypothetical protein
MHTICGAVVEVFSGNRFLYLETIVNIVYILLSLEKQNTVLL